MRESNRISLDQLSVYDYEHMAASFMCLFMGVESPAKQKGNNEEIELISPQYVGRGSKVVIAMRIASDIVPKEVRRIEIRIGALKVNTYQWDGRVLKAHLKIPGKAKPGAKDVRITFRKHGQGICQSFTKESGIIVT